MKVIILRHKKAIFITLTLIWTCIIFTFSLQPADASSELSQGFGRWLVETFCPRLIEYMESMSQEQLDFWHHILRKCGHFTEYCILGILTGTAVIQTKISKKKLSALGYCVLVASVDETIQLFVSGRSGQITDVMLDSAGALTGVMSILIYYKWFKIKN